MSRSVVVVATCDQPHGDEEIVTEGVVTVEFGCQGTTFETELCPQHLAEYRTLMSDYLAHGARRLPPK